MAKHCGTCGRWQQENQEKRPVSLRTLFNGICELSKEEKKSYNDGCWYHTEADHEELEKRGFKEVAG